MNGVENTWMKSVVLVLGSMARLEILNAREPSLWVGSMKLLYNPAALEQTPEATHQLELVELLVKLTLNPETTPT